MLIIPKYQLEIGLQMVNSGIEHWTCGALSHYLLQILKRAIENHVMQHKECNLGLDERLNAKRPQGGCNTGMSNYPDAECSSTLHKIFDRIINIIIGNNHSSKPGRPQVPHPCHRVITFLLFCRPSNVRSSNENMPGPEYGILDLKIN